MRPQEKLVGERVGAEDWSDGNGSMGEPKQTAGTPAPPSRPRMLTWVFTLPGLQTLPSHLHGIREDSQGSEIRIRFRILESRPLASHMLIIENFRI